MICEIIGKGLGYSSEEINALSYEGLESRIAGTVNSIEDNPLLKAVAGAVAEAGPWGASMEQVARRSGLSKSSLYCHFRSRRDMLYQLFMTESLRIIGFARQGMGRSEAAHEQLYLGIFSVAEYLRSKPDILVALDWIRNRRLEIGPHGDTDQADQANPKCKGPLTESLLLFDELDIRTLKNGENPFRGIQISHWILFLIVTTLMRENQGQKTLGYVSNSDIRCLYRFLTLGIKGFKT